MLIANCTQSCSRVPVDNWETTYWYFTAPSKINIKVNYDSDRYELVEKKDWKISQLKERIKSYKEGIEEYNEKEAYYSKCISNFMEEVNKLEKELKGLES